MHFIQIEFTSTYIIPEIFYLVQKTVHLTKHQYVFLQSYEQWDKQGYIWLSRYIITLVLVLIMFGRSLRKHSIFM